MLDLSKIYNSSNYGQFKILNYINYKSVEIEFLETGYKTTTRTMEIRGGKVKDKLLPAVYGVGFLGDGEHKPSVDGKSTKAYNTWIGMLQRCYDPKFHSHHPTYIECTVDPTWYNFQNFAEWFELNYIEGFDLDKDCKIENNKVYSPDNCIFVSHKDNIVKAHAKHYIFISPKGETVNVYNLCKFCRENGLHQSSMVQVAKGKASHHKQWTCSYE